MRVLVACEFSGIVRDAFRARGHDALSVDLLPTERPGPHIQADVNLVLHYPGRVLGGMPRWMLAGEWDMMVAHPPCQFLSNSGVRWLYGGKGTERDPVRWDAMERAAEFVRMLLDAAIPRIAVENPIMHPYGRAIVGRGPDQLIQPWQFGHGETKATGLWLGNLPALTPTEIVDGRVPRVHHASPGPERWKERSRTLPGIADAMAEQWGSL